MTKTEKQARDTLTALAHYPPTDDTMREVHEMMVREAQAILNRAAFYVVTNDGV